MALTRGVDMLRCIEDCERCLRSGHAVAAVVERGRRQSAFFAGLSVEETAETLRVSAETVRRDWRLAKLWLLRELEGQTS
jgi:ECF sigma factor